jgi:hypothetical protein
MFDDDRHHVSEGLVSTAQVGSAKRVARLLAVGFGLCEDEGYPLSERQQIALLTAAFLSFDGFEHETRDLLGIERVLGTLGALAA